MKNLTQQDLEDFFKQQCQDTAAPENFKVPENFTGPLPKELRMIITTYMLLTIKLDLETALISCWMSGFQTGRYYEEWHGGLEELERMGKL